MEETRENKLAELREKANIKDELLEREAELSNQLIAEAEREDDVPVQ